MSKTIDLQTSDTGGQAADYSAIVRDVDCVLRVRIHADTSYAAQSWANVELWTSEGWKEVHRILSSNVNNNRTLKRGNTYYVDFTGDCAELLRVARAVLRAEGKVAI